ncbi:anti-sigma factor [Flavobacteriales bacterium 34_180_T64]|nr:anti-sigma factor [Flavobacteriales bacterium 34_180_T64]
MEKEYLVEKWLNDDLTPAEMEAFEALDDYQMHVDILEKAKHFKASNYSSASDFQTFNKNYQSQNTIRKSSWLNPMLRIASVLVVAVAVYFSFFNDDLVQIQTLAGHKTTVELPDLSQVTLNAGSFIAYHKKDWKENRTLELNGEAYFKVAKGKTFDVVTTNGIVTVVGTQFNVKQRLNYFEVKCFEGLVKVSSDTIIRQLYAGDTYRIIDGIFLENTTVDVAPKWTTNRSSFSAVPFSEVLSELERQYDIQVVFENNTKMRLFTGGFTHDNINNALNAILQPMNMTYEMNSSNQVVIHEIKK